MMPPVYAILNAAEAVTALVGADAAARIYHREAPQSPTAPYVVWFVVAGEPENELSAAPSVDRAVFQVDVYGRTPAEVNALYRAVRDALEAQCHMTAFLVDERGVEAPRLYRMAAQFDHWLSR